MASSRLSSVCASVGVIICFLKFLLLLHRLSDVYTICLIQYGLSQAYRNRFNWIIAIKWKAKVQQIRVSFCTYVLICSSLHLFIVFAYRLEVQLFICSNIQSAWHFVNFIEYRWKRISENIFHDAFIAFLFCDLSYLLRWHILERFLLVFAVPIIAIFAYDANSRRLLL